MFPQHFFDRADAGDDREFYSFPRFVTHIDDAAIDAVGQLYEELGIGGRVLDLMSSWVSHFRTPRSTSGRSPRARRRRSPAIP